MKTELKVETFPTKMTKNVCAFLKIPLHATRPLVMLHVGPLKVQDPFSSTPSSCFSSSARPSLINILAATSNCFSDQ